MHILSHSMRAAAELIEIESKSLYLGGEASKASCSSGKRRKSLTGSQWSSEAELIPHDSKLQSFATAPISLQDLTVKFITELLHLRVKSIFPIHKCDLFGLLLILERFCRMFTTYGLTYLLVYFS